ncbi:fluoride efflux transporter FluC [Halalkalibacter akibai]|uniref:Fluoride-specific ion channel FluC n=1 Tax=Halalkalibacter akibai (strain ATCC 43226 / DSM 21942 / CIP 109018 / JCM 9157 / 1139) TaxID=1236973 RepID=W4QSI2_HALA3|nr:CrcB family protein [Halalkalibacter akibai]GAE35046.1 CrcB protein [Halalkalibacter akibai JCM 9157]
MNDLPKNLIAIGIGSALGTFSRYSLNLLTLESGYPFGTIIENLFGSLLLGFLTAWFIYFIPKEWVKVGLGVGLCGGFTTMSTLAADATFLYQTSSPFESAIYIGGSLFGGMMFALIGYRSGSLLANRSRQKREVNTK